MELSQAKTARQKITFAQPRFERGVYEQIRIAARSEGLTISGWIRRQCMVALAEREKKSN